MTGILSVEMILSAKRRVGGLTVYVAHFFRFTWYTTPWNALHGIRTYFINLEIDFIWFLENFREDLPDTTFWRFTRFKRLYLFINFNRKWWVVCTRGKAMTTLGPNAIQLMRRFPLSCCFARKAYSAFPFNNFNCVAGRNASRSVTLPVSLNLRKATAEKMCGCAGSRNDSLPTILVLFWMYPDQKLFTKKRGMCFTRLRVHQVPAPYPNVSVNPIRMFLHQDGLFR